MATLPYDIFYWQSLLGSILFLALSAWSPFSSNLFWWLCDLSTLYVENAKIVADSPRVLFIRRNGAPIGQAALRTCQVSTCRCPLEQVMKLGKIDWSALFIFFVCLIFWFNLVSSGSIVEWNRLDEPRSGINLFCYRIHSRIWNNSNDASCWNRYTGAPQSRDCRAKAKKKKLNAGICSLFIFSTW